MATVVKPQRPRQLANTRTATQKMCIGMGYLFLVIGLAGIVLPGMLGMHLSMMHNFIHLGSGALALWSGYADNPRKAYNFCIGFGGIYGILGVAGFIFGEPGYPGVGHMEADENLLRIIPNVLEFGAADHTIHIFISAVFLITSFIFRRSHAETGVQKDRYKTVSNFSITDSKPIRPEIDPTMINRNRGNENRSDFERRV